MQARVATLATVSAVGRPHLVPFTFVLDEDVIYSAVDHKPKTGGKLARVVNVERDPRATVLVDRYDEDWMQLWWCRLDGTAYIIDDEQEQHRALDALQGKYEQYSGRRPTGPVIGIRVHAWSGWASRPS